MKNFIQLKMYIKFFCSKHDNFTKYSHMRFTNEFNNASVRGHDTNENSPFSRLEFSYSSRTIIYILERTYINQPERENLNLFDKMKI